MTEFEAWRPAFSNGGPSLVQLARKHAPKLTIIANESLDDAAQAIQVLEDGADLVALGRGALTNPNWPQLVAEGRHPKPFDADLLAPLGDIKPSEIGG